MPNVSFCNDDRSLHYNPYEEPVVVSVWNIEDKDIGNPISIVNYDDYYYPTYFSLIEVDGKNIDLMQLDNDQGCYTFLNSGEHIIKYSFVNSTRIDNNAFKECDKLVSIEIPNDVTSIGGYAFASCTSLTSVTIPNSVTSIGEVAFAGCSGLTSIDIPSGVTSIDNNAFFSCSSLKSVTVEATTPPTLGLYAFHSTNCPIYVPTDSVATYQAASGWSAYASRIQAIQNE